MQSFVTERGNYTFKMTLIQTFPRQASWDCQNLIRLEVERAGLVGLDGTMMMSGDPGSLLWEETRQGFNHKLLKRIVNRVTK